MNKAKQQRLVAKGWKVGGVSDFLGLTPEEAIYIELKLVLSDKVKELRRQKKLTQTEAAKLLGSSQSRVAKMEAGDNSVSLDLLVQSLIALGATRKDIARIIAS
jgi:predicted XRE-type DNA-binding protein